MGFSASAFLVVGIPLSEVFEVRSIKQEVTRYDPITGRPFQTLLEATQLFWMGQRIEEPGEVYPSVWVPRLSDGRLAVCDTGEAATFYGKKGWPALDLNSYIAGKMLAGFVTIGECNPCPMGFTEEHIAEVCNEVATILRELGYAGREEPKVWLVTSASC